jgi:hypothetical protein
MEFREILKMFDFDPKPPADEDRDDEVGSAGQKSLKPQITG